MALEIGGFREVVNTAPANPITTDDPLRPADGWRPQAGLAVSVNALDQAAPVDFDPTQPVGSDSFFERLAARLGSLVGSISRSLSSAASGSQGSQAVAGTRRPTELFLSNHNPAGDDGLSWGLPNRSQPGATTGSVITGMMARLGLSGSSGGSPLATGLVESIGISGSFDPEMWPPPGSPPGSRFIEAYPLVYSIHGISPPPPGFILGRMVPDPLPLRKYYLSCTTVTHNVPWRTVTRS